MPVTVPEVTIPFGGIVTESLRRYSQSFLSIIAIAVLLYPITILPGFIVVALPAEVYLIDRLYSQITGLRKISGQSQKAIPAEDDVTAPKSRDNPVVRPSGYSLLTK